MNASEVGSPLTESVTVGGTEVRYGVSGQGERHLLLVHGSSAHHQWWHAVLPALEKRWRVVRMDLSGHGDSGHRNHYDLGIWVADVRAVLTAVGARDTVVVGHSLGGRVALAAAAEHPPELGGLVLLDMGVFAPEHLARRRDVSARRGEREYATFEEATGRFRLVPEQPTPRPEILEPVARSSVRPTPGGWTWKYDQRGFPPLYGPFVTESAAALKVPVGFVYGELSTLVDAAAARHIRAAASTEVKVSVLPGAHHHLMLDSPDACAALIDEMASSMAVET